MVLNNIFYNIDLNTMLLGTLFIIFYVLINFSLSKFFKKERASSTIISLCVSLLAVYGINRTNLDISGIFSNIGISEEIIYLIAPWIIIGLAVLSSFAKDDTTGKRRFRLYRLLMVLGGFFILLSFFAYEQTITMIVGIALIVLGLAIWIFVTKKNSGQSSISSPSSKSSGLFWIFWITLSAGLIVYGLMSGNPWFSIGGGIALCLALIAYFLGSKKKGNLNPQSQNGSDALISAAKRFHDWAKHQPNPKFVGSWANFINYLKRGGWGNNEAEICRRLNISQNDFVRIFRRYGLV